MPLISSKIEPRNKTPIFNIISRDYGDRNFSIVGYYVSDKEAIFLVRRLDKDTGWNFDLKVKVDNIEINIGSSSENCLEKTVQTNLLKFVPVTYQNQRIPKIVVQTSSNYEVTTYMYNSIMTFVDLNPEYEYQFFNNINRRQFIKENFTDSLGKEILEAYDTLIPGAFQADLFRLCFLYKIGGCYFDCKNILKIPLRDLIEPNETEILMEDRYPGTKANGVIFSIPGNEFLLKNIKMIIFNVTNRKFTNNALGVTGPGTLELCTKNIISKFKNNFYNNETKDCYILQKTGEIFCYPRFKGYYEEYTKRNNQEYYDKLWSKSLVFYDKIYENESYKVLAYPKPKVSIKNKIDKLEIRLFKNSKINIINKLTNENIYIDDNNKNNLIKLI